MLDCHTVVYDCQGLGLEQGQAIKSFENQQKRNNEHMVKKGFQGIFIMTLL